MCRQCEHAGFNIYDDTAWTSRFGTAFDHLFERLTNEPATLDLTGTDGMLEVA